MLKYVPSDVHAVDAGSAFAQHFTEQVRIQRFDDRVELVWERGELSALLRALAVRGCAEIWVPATVLGGTDRTGRSSVTLFPTHIEMLDALFSTASEVRPVADGPARPGPQQLHARIAVRGCPFRALHTAIETLRVLGARATHFYAPSTLVSGEPELLLSASVPSDVCAELLKTELVRRFPDRRTIVHMC